MTEEKHIDLHERLLMQSMLNKLEVIEANQLRHERSIAAMRERMTIFSSLYGVLGGIFAAVISAIIKGK